MEHIFPSKLRLEMMKQTDEKELKIDKVSRTYKFYNKLNHNIRKKMICIRILMYFWICLSSS